MRQYTVDRDRLDIDFATVVGDLAVLHPVSGSIRRWVLSEPDPHVEAVLRYVEGETIIDGRTPPPRYRREPLLR